MTVHQVIRLQRANPDKIYLLVRGSFYHAYNEGAEALSSFTGYKVREVKGNRIAGFPIESLGKVVGKIMSKLSGCILDIDSFEKPHVCLTIKS